MKSLSVKTRKVIIRTMRTLSSRSVESSQVSLDKDISKNKIRYSQTMRKAKGNRWI